MFVSTRDGNADVFTMPFALGDTAAGTGAENLTRRVLGTDAPRLPPAEAFHGEVRLLAVTGLTPAQILRAATRNAAAHLGQEDDLGTLEPGKLADLIVVDGNPLEDVSELWNVELVVKGGEVMVVEGNEP